MTSGTDFPRNKVKHFVSFKDLKTGETLQKYNRLDGTMKKATIIKAVLLLSFISVQMFSQNNRLDNPKSDVFMQGFYWNSTPGGLWWDSLSVLAPRLASAGFSAVWVPNAVKGAAGSMSMGYDPYDHYDFGEFLQKGSSETRFGSREELENMIANFHDLGIQVFADAVLRHMMGGEEKIPYECIPDYNGNPIVPDSAWMKFSYPNGSGRFTKDAGSFYPNSENCWVDPLFIQIDPIFRFGEWLDHNKEKVRDSLKVWGHYLRNELGFDGFRLDAVKSISPEFMADWLNDVNSGGYAVAEYWGSQSEIGDWLNQCANVYGADVAMFDFPLRYSLQDMCNNTGGGYDMRNLDWAGLVNSGISGFNVATFAENHDMDRIGWDGSIDDGHNPIISDKQMAYAYMIFSEGRPSVFFKDYFEYGFGGKIDTLMWIRRTFIEGGTTKRDGLGPYYTHPDGSNIQDELAQDIYVARRNGGTEKPATYIVINDNAVDWLGVWVDSDYPNEVFRDYASGANDQSAQADGRVWLWAPPRGYSIYVPDTTHTINNPPVLFEVPDLLAYTNSHLEYQLNYDDVNNDPLTFDLTGNPGWLMVNDQGLLYGSPAVIDTGSAEVIITISDPNNETVTDTFMVSVELNYPPVITEVPDTTVKATERYQYQVSADDPDEDELKFSLLESPGWLKIGTETGLLSGTPAIEDTGYYFCVLEVADGKGAFDSTEFNIKVIEKIDTLIATYGKPNLDGNVLMSDDDWLDDWLVVADPDTDSYWNPGEPKDNEVIKLFFTWDSDSLYVGVDYICNDDYNTMMLYLDAGIEGGITDFSSAGGFNGHHAKNFRFRQDDGVDFYFADYYIQDPNFYRVDSNASTDITERINAFRGENARGMEAAISWDDIYGLGAGLIPENVKLKMVGLIAGGFDYGGGDSAPDNPDVDGDIGPDSLIYLGEITPDEDGDGIPDPTIFITTRVEEIFTDVIPQNYILNQNYPNPFNPETTISFGIPESGKVNLSIYDILGRKVAELVNENLPAGNYNHRFNAANFASGVYFYRITVNDFSAVKKLVLMK